MNQPDMSVVEASEIVPASPEKVWGVLTNSDSWQEWWDGHKLTQVEPAWEKGATLIWERGNPSTVFDFQPAILLDFASKNMSMEIHRYFKLTKQSNTTKIVYGFAVKGATIGNKNEERQKMVATLQRLKEAVKKRPNTVNAEDKKWWQFWK